MTSKKHRLPLLLAVAFVALVPRMAHACAVCMGAQDSQIAPAVNAMLFFMLGLLVLVLGSVGGFVFYLGRRAKMPLQPHHELAAMINPVNTHHA